MYLEYKLLTTFDSPLTSLDLLAKNILNTHKLNSGPHLCRYDDMKQLVRIALRVKNCNELFLSHINHNLLR
jgi:hypothetical protein